MAQGTFNQADFLAAGAKARGKKPPKKKEPVTTTHKDPLTNKTIFTPIPKGQTTGPTLPKPVTPKLTGDALLNSQIKEAQAAGNLDDVKTLQGLLGGGAQPTDIKTNLQDAQTKLRTGAAKASFEAAFGRTEGRLEQERKALTPKFREEERQLRTADTMARTASEKGLAGLGLAASGARPQTDISQNVITGEAGAAGAARESNQRADIERRLSEAQSLRDQGFATAESEAEFIRLEDELRKVGIQEERDRFETERTREDFITNIDATPDHTQAIQDILNDGDPSNDWKIPFHESARQRKIETQGLDPATGQPLPRDTTPTLTSSSAIDLWEQTGVANEAISRALGIPVGTQFTRRSTGSGGTSGGLTATGTINLAKWKVGQGFALSASEGSALGLPEGYVAPGATPDGTPPPEPEKTVFSNTNLQRGINNAVAIAAETPPTEFAADDPNLFNPDIIRTKENAVKIRFIIDNFEKIADQAQLDQLLIDNGISEEEFDKFLPDEPGTGLGDLANLGG